MAPWRMLENGLLATSDHQGQLWGKEVQTLVEEWERLGVMGMPRNSNR